MGLYDGGCNSPATSQADTNITGAMLAHRIAHQATGRSDVIDRVIARVKPSAPHAITDSGLLTRDELWRATTAG